MHAMANGLDAASAKVDAITITPTEGTAMIVGAYKAGTYKRTFLFKGSPGIGKSTLAKDAAAELRLTIPDFQYIEINPTMPADEVGGIPDLIRKEGHATRTDYALPQWFPTKTDNPDWKGIINLDDALQGDKMMQQTLANLILARNLRGHELPDGAMIVATGNRMEDKAGVTRTLTHFADRMCAINIEADATSWIENFAIPKGIDQRVIGYILLDKSKLDMFDPNADKCPTPRTWAAVSDHLKYLDTLKGPGMDNIRNKFAQSILGGELGMGEAIKFWAFCDLFGKLPDLDKVLADPANHDINYAIDIQYALVVALANKVDDTTFGPGLEYITRFGADLAVLAGKLALGRLPELKTSDAWVKWAVKHQDVVMGV